MLDELNPPAIHGEAIAGRSAEARRALLQITAGVVRSTFDLAELLYEVKSAGYYRAYGYETFGEYVMKELDIKQRKSEYLIRIVQVCKAVGLKRADYESAGISKLRSICTLDSAGSYFNPETKTNEDMAEHIVDLIANAPTMDAEEVTERVLELKGMVGPDRPVVRSFSMTQAAWTNVVKKAFERVRKMLGSAGRDDQGMAKEYSDGAVLECLCADYLAGTQEEDSSIPMEEI
jgi:hypothetical protein